MKVRITLTLFLILQIITIAGCATDNGQLYREYVTEGISDPVIGAYATAEIGDNLYQEYIGNISITYYVSLDSKTTIKTDNLQFSVGQEEVSKQLSDKKGSAVRKACFNNLKGAPPVETKIGNTLMWKSYTLLCLTDSDLDGKFESGEINSGEDAKKIYITEPIAYSVKREIEKHYSRLSFEKIILYQGIANGVINISYRELQNNMARPAFTQSIQYEINKNGPTQIAFKGARIEVLSADNTSIRYRVLKPFRDSVVN